MCGKISLFAGVDKAVGWYCKLVRCCAHEYCGIFCYFYSFRLSILLLLALILSVALALRSWAKPI